LNRITTLPWALRLFLRQVIGVSQARMSLGDAQ
jgi:hypothetical protein